MNSFNNWFQNTYFEIDIRSVSEFGF